MIGRGNKSKKARSKGFSRRRLKDDRISQLPDHIICDILSHLCSNDAVRTSVLSTRWKSLWLWVPTLELNSRIFSDINAFVSFGDRFFDPSRVSCIQKLTLSLGKNASTLDDGSYFTSWIEAAIKRKIQHLDVSWSKHIYLYKNPLRLYSCETLVSLKLFGVILDDAAFVVLPCLKTLYFEQIYYPSEAALERLISSCPVLENLKIVASDIDSRVFRVHSRSLKSLSIERYTRIVNNDVSGVVIDAPLLCCFSIDDHQSQSVIVHNLEANAMLDISLNFGLLSYGKHGVSSRRSMIRDFLHGISKVGNMKICPVTFKLICRYAELEPLPQFGYMSLLNVSLHPTCLKWLTKFLGSCPNLKSLILEQLAYSDDREEMTQISFSAVPQCLLSSLEFVDIDVPRSGLDVELKLVSYLLENSAILKKLTLRLHSHSTKDELSEKLYNIPRGSSKCEVVIL